MYSVTGLAAWFLRYASRHAGQTGRQTDRQMDIFFTILSTPVWGAKVVINSEAVKAIKGDLCKGAFI